MAKVASEDKIVSTELQDSTQRPHKATRPPQRTYALELFFLFRGFDAEPSVVSLATMGSSIAAMDASF